MMDLDVVKGNRIDFDNQTVTPGNTTSTAGLQLDDQRDPVIWVVEMTVIIILMGVISGAGLVTNVINVIVFLRRGAFSTSSKISLLALALADIGCLLPLFCNSAAFVVWYLSPTTLFMTPHDYFEIATIWPHVMFVQIASWITAYIAFERCICVVFPLKVKMLFSAKRSFVVVVAIAALIGLSWIPTFVTQRLAEVNDPVTNTTKLVNVATKAFKEIATMSDIIHAMFLRPLAVVLVFICTQITVHRVMVSKTWRKSRLTSPTEPPTSAITRPGGSRKQMNESDTSTPHERYPKTKSSDDDSDKHQTRGITPMATSSTVHSYDKDRRLVLMITTISIIFLVCNTPNIFTIFFLRSPFFKKHFTFRSLASFLLVTTGFGMESINSSINIFVYYRMSSQYRRELRAWLGQPTT